MSTSANTFARALPGFVALSLAAGAAHADPKIEHQPPKASAGADLTITAKITATGQIIDPFVAYRVAGTGEFKTVPLAAGSHHEFSGVIPGSDLTGGAVEYYLGASDGSDMSDGAWHSKEKPQKILLGKAKAGGAAAAKEDKAEVTERRAAAPKKDEAPIPVDALEFKAASEATNATWDHAVVWRIEPPKAMFLPGDAGYLKIVTTPPGATLLFNGADIGTAPVWDTFSDGKYVIQAKMDGYHPAATIVKVSAGVAKQLEMVLKPK